VPPPPSTTTMTMTTNTTTTTTITTLILSSRICRTFQVNSMHSRWICDITVSLKCYN